MARWSAYGAFPTVFSQVRKLTLRSSLHPPRLLHQQHLSTSPPSINTSIQYTNLLVRMQVFTPAPCTADTPSHHGHKREVSWARTRRRAEADTSQPEALSLFPTTSQA